MKKVFYLGLAITVSVIILESFTGIKLGKRDGTEPGHTGSPGDSLKNCTVCHGGLAHEMEGWITSDVPATGYVPGQRYTITATNTNHGSTLFGFQASPQAIDGTLLGTMIITDTITTKLVGDGKYVTYRSSGVEGVDSKSWSWDWIAPAKGTGEVVYYSAYNSNPGHKGGDNTYLSKLVLQENLNSGLNDQLLAFTSFSVYPNPSSDLLVVSYETKTTSKVIIELMDVTGKKIKTLFSGIRNGAVSESINVSEVANGNYLLNVSNGINSSSRKIIIRH